MQEITGPRVLNASMSSYGTAREMTLLGRLALAAETLVIQYSDNDFVENKPYVDHGVLNMKPCDHEKVARMLPAELDWRTRLNR